MLKIGKVIKTNRARYRNGLLRPHTQAGIVTKTKTKTEGKNEM